MMLSKQKGLVPLVLMLFVGISAFIGGVVTVKATDDKAQKVEQVQVAAANDK